MFFLFKISDSPKCRNVSAKLAIDPGFVNINGNYISPAVKKWMDEQLALGGDGKQDIRIYDMKTPKNSEFADKLEITAAELEDILKNNAELAVEFYTEPISGIAWEDGQLGGSSTFTPCH